MHGESIRRRTERRKNRVRVETLVLGIQPHSEEQYLSVNVGRILPNLVNFSMSLFLVFYYVQLWVCILMR
ncbi:hypothetical protein DVH24_033228 [Malus domestica]|uniref:Uncharacterized protein n=1 Tax=Malus domestica TaxID=3750 RepID=A0A498JF02_MALDO|nr:hypothetical protein DVH24_033228 [Malus domestica]